MIPMEPYKSARAEADHIAALLRAALIRAGVSEAQASRIRPLVTGTGRAYVELGAFRMTDANKLLEALLLASAPKPDDSSGLPAESFG
ncbi:hypothetical protein AB0J38_16825 [Streptomyces sp. NPDC050095]|uniref:hypothetical protein n=1 Tax=unclassified Streptomyces TaxID=2593676 RepID=UPI00341EC6CE